MNKINKEIRNSIPDETVKCTYSLKEAANFIGCSEWQMRKFAHDGVIPHYKVGRFFRFSDVSLSRWVLENEAMNVYKSTQNRR